MDFIADQWIRLNQVGISDQNKLALSSAAIDLPIQSIPSLTDDATIKLPPLTASRSAFAAAYISAVGNQVLRSSRIANKLRWTARASRGGPEPRHVVLLGGPGQGKTTIGQLVCQIYRAALLADSPRLSQETSTLLASVRDSLARVGLQLPVNRRWPVRIELAAYADVATDPRNVALLPYIAQHVSSRTSEHVSPSTMRAWLRAWPWLLVLDGLDEVASQQARDVLVQNIADFLVETAQVDCDLLVVATSRPQGYMDEFSPDRYQHIALSPLSPEQAASYAERLAEARHASDPDLLRKLIQRTHIASQEESTARLMRSPLQVTIMSLLLESRERAPQARYALFDAFYQAIYSREAAKPGQVGRLLDELRPHINALHDRVGLLLQVQAEQAGDSDAALPQDELRALALLRLEAEGFTRSDAKRIAGLVVRAVTHRLVLIVPKALNEVGFEVRSIQEFMAARALVTGKDTAVLSRMKLIAPSAHWRNTWLFAAGRVFSEREYLRRDLIALVEDIDNQDVLHVIVAPGADLAVDLLDDDLAVTTPALQRALARHALTLLRCPPDHDIRRRASILYRCASTDSVVRAAAEQAIEQALGGSYAQLAAADQLLDVWEHESGGLGLRARQMARNPRIRELRFSEQDNQESSIPISRLTTLVLDEEALESSDRLLVERLIAYEVPRNEAVEISRVTNECLSRPACATAVAKVVLALETQSPHDAALLRGMLRNWLSRKPSGAEVLRETAFPDYIDNSSMNS